MFLILTIPTARSLTYEIFVVVVQKPNNRIGIFISYKLYSEPTMPKQKTNMNSIYILSLYNK